jgi:hypothetical protein
VRASPTTFREFRLEGELAVRIGGSVLPFGSPTTSLVIVEAIAVRAESSCGTILLPHRASNYFLFPLHFEAELIEVKASCRSKDL